MVKRGQDKKVTTIDDLARMVQKGFENTASAQELGDFRAEANTRFERIDTRFNKVETRLDNMENRFIGAHENRIERLEDDMRQVKTALKIGK